MTRTTTTRTLSAPTRKHVRTLLVAANFLALLGNSLCRAASPGALQQMEQHPAPVVRQAPPAPQRSVAPQAGQSSGFAPHSGQNQEHLQQWMQSHSNLTVEQQQHALDNEPGFHQLSPEAQQRMHQRLAQLNGMSPEQRQRTYARTEAMERLAPEQRQQVRNALTGLGNLPRDRRMYVAREFRAMRDMPQAERQAFMNSPAMRAQFSDQERQVLNRLFEAAPYMPSPQQPASSPMMPYPAPMPPQ